jgi:hypothetical protein
MSLKIACFGLLTSASVCCAAPLDYCSQYEPPLAHYNEGLAIHLSKGKIKHAVTDKGVCVASQDAKRLESAAEEFGNYFYDVAELLRDACEERAFVEWATRNRLRFEVRSTDKGRRMFFLRSFNAEEVALNRQRLRNEGPKGVRCATQQGKP